MKYGDELEIRLVDSTGHAYYTEPFDVEVGSTSTNFRGALETFRENSEDAISTIVEDIEMDKRLKDFSEYHLASALRNRGWDVEKRTEKAIKLTPTRPCGCV